MAESSLRLFSGSEPCQVPSTSLSLFTVGGTWRVHVPTRIINTCTLQLPQTLEVCIFGNVNFAVLTPIFSVTCNCTCTFAFILQ